MGTTTIAIDFDAETAVFDWGTGPHALFVHRYPGARDVAEYTMPEGRIVRVRGFRSGLHELWALLLRADAEAARANGSAFRVSE